jgi:hypothetical protein
MIGLRNCYVYEIMKIRKKKVDEKDVGRKQE